MMRKIKGFLEGWCEIQSDVLIDNRGCFIKTVHEEWYREMGVPFSYAEEYCSTSQKGVLRGLHFQLPPKEHSKLVYCSAGKILDVAVDLRKSSPTYGQYQMVELSGEKGNMVFIPKGFAHGFYTLSDVATIVCKQSNVFDAQADSGIRWDSVGIPWPAQNPILSDKDKKHVRLEDFISPFI
ncbi:dTDP-4-dehydrorhamnose 3,5-epimerase [Selenomonas ruminantium]|uniref:dTDP-4-dehydrorhamnose 3,5-epimerase n=1 Tax=Selenomonas ruminantium TaxID=971 RepID=UPI0026EF6748|nr:dTDP-4-dehydrorhamnose 3,5-epimerase [Selenomonas ruminantium]